MIGKLEALEARSISFSMCKNGRRNCICIVSHLLVNDAGIGRDHPAHDASVQYIKYVMRIDLSGVHSFPQDVSFIKNIGFISTLCVHAVLHIRYCSVL